MQFVNQNRRANLDIPPDFLINHVSGSFVEMVLWWIQQGMALAPGGAGPVFSGGHRAGAVKRGGRKTARGADGSARRIAAGTGTRTGRAAGRWALVRRLRRGLTAAALRANAPRARACVFRPPPGVHAGRTATIPVMPRRAAPGMRRGASPPPSGTGTDTAPAPTAQSGRSAAYRRAATRPAGPSGPIGCPPRRPCRPGI